MSDFLQDCMSDVQTADKAGFIECFCKHCRNPQCERSGWASDKFGNRVIEQVDRLFNPVRADPASSRYQGIIDFQECLQEALRLEIADQRGDWSIPEISISDGVPHTSTSSDVDYAVSRLRNNPMKFMGEEVPKDPPVEDIPEPEAPAKTPSLPILKPHKTGAGDVSMKNVPKRTGIMIGEGDNTPIPNIDPWEAPINKPQVVLPGATIKLEG